MPNLTREEADKLMEQRQKENEAISKRFKEIEADKLIAEQRNASVTLTIREDEVQNQRQLNAAVYEEWKADRDRINQEREERCSRAPPREWDVGKVDQSEEETHDAKPYDGRWQSSSGSFSSKDNKPFGSYGKRNYDNQGWQHRGYKTYSNQRSYRSGNRHQPQDVSAADGSNSSTKPKYGTVYFENSATRNSSSYGRYRGSPQNRSRYNEGSTDLDRKGKSFFKRENSEDAPPRYRGYHDYRYNQQSEDYDGQRGCSKSSDQRDTSESTTKLISPRRLKLVHPPLCQIPNTKEERVEPERIARVSSGTWSDNEEDNCAADVHKNMSVAPDVMDPSAFDSPVLNKAASVIASSSIVEATLDVISTFSEQGETIHSLGSEDTTNDDVNVDEEEITSSSEEDTEDDDEDEGEMSSESQAMDSKESSPQSAGISAVKMAVLTRCSRHRNSRSTADRSVRRQPRVDATVGDNTVGDGASVKDDIVGDGASVGDDTVGDGTTVSPLRFTAGGDGRELNLIETSDSSGADSGNENSEHELLTDSAPGPGQVPDQEFCPGTDIVIMNNNSSQDIPDMVTNEERVPPSTEEDVTVVEALMQWTGLVEYSSDTEDEPSVEPTSELPLLVEASDAGNDNVEASESVADVPKDVGKI